jgi:hypothetical protein
MQDPPFGARELLTNDARATHQWNTSSSYSFDGPLRAQRKEYLAKDHLHCMQHSRAVLPKLILQLHPKMGTLSSAEGNSFTLFCRRVQLWMSKKSDANRQNKRVLSE